MRERWLTDWPTSDRFPHYTRANAGEVLADPVSPLGWSFGWDRGIVEGYKEGLIRCGVYEDTDFDDEYPETVANFGGYFYINLSAIRLQGARNPAASVEVLDQAFFGDHPDVPPYVAHPDDDKPHLLPSIEAHTAWVMSGDRWTDLDDDKRDAAELRRGRPDLTEPSDVELLARARDVQRRLPHLFSQHVVSGTSAAVAPGLLAVVAEAIDEPGLPMTMLSTLGEVDSADANYALWDLSRIVRADPELSGAFDESVVDLLDRVRSREFQDAWRDFVYEFGSRGPDEWDLRAPTWETHPELALAAVERLRLQSDSESPNVRAQRRAAERDRLLASARGRLADDSDTLGLLEAGLTAGRLMADRERTKTTIVRVLHEARMSFRELGRRRGHDELVFQLLDDELDSYVADPGSFTELLLTRHAEWRELFELQPPFIIADAVVPPLTEWERRTAGQPDRATIGATLNGVAGSPGVARGIARVILQPDDPGRLAPGDILVAPNTDSSWTPLFMAAGGVVVDVGGQISHAVIVSRELAVPCVVSVTDGTRIIPDGALVEVDGANGTVIVLEHPRSEDHR